MAQDTKDKQRAGKVSIQNTTNGNNVIGEL